MKPLETHQDIVFLVNSFYDQVRKDSVIGHFFNDIAKVNWNEHLPKMVRFWESLLFGAASYKGNPMAAHFPINDIQPIENHHFEHWLKLWTKVVQTHFEGEKADLAIYKAQNISQLMAYKMEMARR